jgi:tetratricopeptide (TPR) repeat protein
MDARTENADSSRDAVVSKQVVREPVRKPELLDQAMDQRQEGEVSRVDGEADCSREGTTEEREEQGTYTAASIWSWIDPTNFDVSKKDFLKAEPEKEDTKKTVHSTTASDASWNNMNMVLSTIVAWIDPEPTVEEKKVEPPGQKSKDDRTVCDDDSGDGSISLGGNLKSLASVNDVTVSEASLSSADIGTRHNGKSDASAVESTMKALDLPSSVSSRIIPSSQASSVSSKMNPSKTSGPMVSVSKTSPSKTNALKDAAIPKTTTPITTEETTETKKGLTSIPESIDTRRNLLIKELRQAVSTHGRYDIRCANISAALGDLLGESGQHEQAIKLHKDAVTIYSCKLGDDHTTTTNAKICLGTVLEKAGLYDEAINMYYIATSMRRSVLGEQDPSVADGFIYMAHALRKKTEYSQSIKELKRALKIYREALGDAHEKVSAAVDEIASLYVTIGDFGKASAILEEVVKLKAATLGAGHKAVGATLSSLATTYECSSEFEKAMKALKKAYKIYTDLGGFSCEEATTVLNRMAQLYEATGDYHRAAIAYLGVLRGRKVINGSQDLVVGETYYRLGCALRQTGQLDKALKCMKEALPVFVNKASEVNDANLIAEIMHEMALINKEKKNHTDAARIFKQELGIRRKLGQPDFPVIARTLNHLGVAEYELGNSTRALKYLVEALTIFQGQGEESLDCGEVLFNTGLVFEAVRNNNRALEAFTESARIFADHGHGDDHPHLSKANHKIEKLQGQPKNQSDKAKAKSGSGRKRLFK